MPQTLEGVLGVVESQRDEDGFELVRHVGKVPLAFVLDLQKESARSTCMRVGS